MEGGRSANRRSRKDQNSRWGEPREARWPVDNTSRRPKPARKPKIRAPREEKLFVSTGAIVVNLPRPAVANEPDVVPSETPSPVSEPLIDLSEPDDQDQTAEAQPAAEYEHIAEAPYQPKNITAESSPGVNPSPPAVTIRPGGIQKTFSQPTEDIEADTPSGVWRSRRKYEAAMETSSPPEPSRGRFTRTAEQILKEFQWPDKHITAETYGGATSSSAAATKSLYGAQKEAYQPTMDAQSGFWRPRQRHEPTTTEPPSPTPNRRGCLTRIAIDSEGQRVGRLTPPPRPETPLIDLGDDTPPATAKPAVIYEPPHVDRPAALPPLDLGANLFDEVGEGREGEPSQILVAFDPLLMCPCNLEGHPCMLPLRCRYQPGVICTKFPCACPWKYHLPATCASIRENRACEWGPERCYFGHDPPGFNAREVQARKHGKHHFGDD